jgi:nucleotide-binding universal stress UspA family protein
VLSAARSTQGRIATGTHIDGFRVGAEVHAGPMASVFHVEQAGLERRLGMKVPRLGPDAPSESSIAFQTEATILPTLTGRHVPPFVAKGELGRSPYLVTEWVEGQSLEEALAFGPLPPPVLARIGAAIADALDSLHQQDVIHLDLKPSNLIVRPDGSVVLIDFGFAHHARYPDLFAEETRHRAGSAPYVSPEQLLGRRDDRRSDLFAFGVVLYEMATGKLPFGEADTDVRNRFWLEPVPPASLAPELPSWLQEVVLRCLEPRPDLRYQSAADVAFDLSHPERVVLTARASKRERAGLFVHFGRFLRARAELGVRLRAPAPLRGGAPSVLVAVDTAHLDDARHVGLRLEASRLLAESAEVRLLCLTVIAPGASAFEHLIRLRHWTQPLCLASQRLSLHAVESDSPADVIVELARHNDVVAVILGAPARGGRAWAQSVASTVTANTGCSVHLVRDRQR